jgi:Flp pilus assembly pilin Flp
MPSRFELLPNLSTALFSTTMLGASAVSNETISISSHLRLGSDRSGAINVEFLVLAGVVAVICVAGMEDLRASKLIC